MKWSRSSPFVTKDLKNNILKPSACQLYAHTTIPTNMIGSICQLWEWRSIRSGDSTKSDETSPSRSSAQQTKFLSMRNFKAQIVLQLVQKQASRQRTTCIDVLVVHNGRPCGGTLSDNHTRGHTAPHLISGRVTPLNTCSTWLCWASQLHPENLSCSSTGCGRSAFLSHARHADMSWQRASPWAQHFSTSSPSNLGLLGLRALPSGFGRYETRRFMFVCYWDLNVPKNHEFAPKNSGSLANFKISDFVNFRIWNKLNS